MNHIAKDFKSSDGRVYRSHSWEQREGGYRRAALVVGNGIWNADKEPRMVSFLLNRGFRVLSLDLAFGSSRGPRARLFDFRKTISDFAKEATPLGMPLYLIASSFSASALMPIAAGIPGIVALAMIGPIVEFTPLKLKRRFFILPTVDLSVEREDQSGMPELLDGLQDKGELLRFNIRDLRAAVEDVMLVRRETLGLPAIALAGEADPWLSQEGRNNLARADVRVYSYPRVKREPGYDRYADNYYADLGSFLDEIEAGKR
jgi:hypothetical protein